MVVVLNRFGEAAALELHDDDDGDRQRNQQIEQPEQQQRRQHQHGKRHPAAHHENALPADHGQHARREQTAEHRAHRLLAEAFVDHQHVLALLRQRGGARGRRLLTYVRDVMRTGDQLPVVRDDATVRDALFQLTAKRMGMTAIVDQEERVAGIFTDGDLRRVLERAGDFRNLPIGSVMTKAPRTIAADHLAVEAVELMERHRINQMLVVDPAGKLIGALNMHDLFSKKVI